MSKKSKNKSKIEVNTPDESTPVPQEETQPEQTEENQVPVSTEQPEQKPEPKVEAEPQEEESKEPEFKPEEDKKHEQPQENESQEQTQDDKPKEEYVPSTKWTVDIRESLESNVTEEDLDKVFEEHRSRDLDVNHIFCTPEQAKAIKKTKYSKVQLTEA